MTWKQYGDLAYYAATSVTMLFSIMYFLFAPWWKSVGGRNIMAVMGSVALVFGYFAWAIWYGRVPIGYHPIRAMLFTFVTLSIGWRVSILVRYHILRSLRKTPKEGSDELENAR